MRKYIFLQVLFILLLSSIHLHAQRFDGGFKLGLSLSQVDGDTYAGYNKAGLTGGMYVKTAMKNNFFAKMEIIYKAAGAHETGTIDDPVNYKLALHYIRLPLAIEYVYDNQWTAEAGFSNGYLMGHYAEGMDGTGNIVEILNDVPLKSYDLGILFGVGYILNDRVSFNARFTYSLLPIRKYPNLDFNYGPLARTLGVNKGDYNNILSFTVNYTL